MRVKKTRPPLKSLFSFAPRLSSGRFLDDDGDEWRGKGLRERRSKKKGPSGGTLGRQSGSGSTPTAAGRMYCRRRAILAGVVIWLNVLLLLLPPLSGPEERDRVAKVPFRRRPAPAPGSLRGLPLGEKTMRSGNGREGGGGRGRRACRPPSCSPRMREIWHNSDPGAGEGAGRGEARRAALFVRAH